jgi:hypothetical protein
MSANLTSLSDEALLRHRDSIVRAGRLEEADKRATFIKQLEAIDVERQRRVPAETE